MSPDRPERAVVFANGESGCLHRLELRTSDYIVAVDGGLNGAQALGRLPDLLIGDLDSITPEQLQLCVDSGVEILRFPVAKDENDLQLALNEVAQRGFKQVLVAAALGGRTDHTLSNLALLANPDYAAMDLQFDDGCTVVRLMRGPQVLKHPAAPGDTVSLIPWQGEARGIRTEGLQYPLNDETLHPWQTRGLSNIAATSQLQVSIQDGQLLLVHNRENTERQPC